VALQARQDKRSWGLKESAGLPGCKAREVSRVRQDKLGSTARLDRPDHAALQALKARKARQEQLGQSARVAQRARKARQARKEDKMPPFMTQPPALQPRRGITAGLPSYSFGSFPLGQQPARMYITALSVSANVVTANVRMVEGNVPAVGALATVTGTTAAGAPANVTNVAIASIVVNAQGVGQITYPATTPNIGVTPDGGQVIFNPTDVGETTAVAKGQQFALDAAGGYGVTMVWASTAATVALQLEGAVDDVDAQYALIGTSQATLTGSVIAQLPNNVRFVRVNTTAFTGGPGTLWAKIYQSTSTGM
jgi:hypothetical protein